MPLQEDAPDGSGKGRPVLATALGFLLLLHAAFLASEHRAELSLVGQEAGAPPVAVLAELAVGSVVCTYAALGLAGSFKPITQSKVGGKKFPEAMTYRQGFVNFNTRARLLPPSPAGK